MINKFYKIKSKLFYIMDLFNDVGNFIEDYTPIGVIEKSLRGVKRETKNPILKPMETVINEVNPIKIDSSGVNFKTPDIYQDALNVFQEIQKDVKIAGEGIVKGEQFLEDQLVYIESGVEEVFVDTSKVFKSLFRIFENVGIPIIEFAANNPKLIIFATATYSGLLVFNQAKLAVSWFLLYTQVFNKNYNICYINIMPNNKISIKLISCSTNVILPQPLNKIQNVKISKLLYKIITPNIRAVKISIPRFNNHSFFNGEKSINYFFIIFNDGNSNNLINYNNIYDISDYTDEYNRSLNSFNMTVTDDDDNLLSEISIENPMMLELEFY